MTDETYLSDMIARLSELAAALQQDYANECGTGATASAVHVLLARMEQDSARQQLRGLAYLFRMLHKLPMRWPDGGLTAHDHVALSDWTGHVCDYLLGTLPSVAVPLLVDTLRRLSWMPPLEQRLSGMVTAALLGDTPLLLQAAAQRDAQRPGAGPLPPRQGDSTDCAAPEDTPAFAFDEIPAAEPDPVPRHAAFAAPDESLAAQAPAADAQAVVEADAAAQDQTAPWIALEELALISDAVAAQLLPAATAVLEAQHQSAPVWAEALDACGEQLDLVLAAMDALGLDALHTAGKCYARLLQRLREHGPAQSETQALDLWPVLLIGYLQEPRDSAAAQDLVAVLDERGLLDGTGGAALAQRLTAVRIGVDPTLLAARKRSASEEDVALDVAEDVLPSVLAGMLQELPGRSAEFSARIQHYLRERNPADLDAARRIAHTLKGDGNIVGVRGIANLTHTLEEILVIIAARPDDHSAEIDAVLIDAADGLEAMSDCVLGRGPAPDDSVALLQRVLDCANALHEDGTGAELPAATAAAGDDEGAATAGEGAATAAAGDVAATAAAPAEAAAPSGEAAATITVPMRLLDDLLRLTGEAVIYARQVENRVERVERRHGDINVQGKTFESLIGELQQLVEVRGAALTSQRLNEGEEFDDLEMDRYNELHTVTLRLVEAGADARASAQDLNQDVVGLRDLLAQQDRLHLELRERVQQARTVPLLQLLPRLQRVVRQTARQLGKPCELRIEGEQTLLDKELLEGLAEPLLHLLRNAVDHGIEPPAQRSAAGKPAQGSITLGFLREADQVRIRCRDDGAGLDFAAIRRKATERGLLPAGQEHDEQALSSLIFRTGFSTRLQATLTSGRGLGMDIVHRRITALKGSISLRSEAGRGCEFELRLPLSQVSAHVLLARAGNHPVAINLAGVQRMVLAEHEQLRQDPQGLGLHLTDEPRREALPLDTLLGFSNPAGTPAGSSYALLVELDAQRSAAVMVDAVGDARSVIVKNLGPHVAANPGVLGATILGDGSIATVVDLPQLIARRQRGSAPLPAAGTQQAASGSVPVVLVVDDSLSVRRSLEQVIGDAGFRVSSARDGLEAVERVRAQRPDLMIIDLEMPRMNGLELASFIRKDETTRAIPIIMITSRTTERHRELARSAGVDTVLSKPYSEDSLLALIVDKLLRGRAAA